MAALRRRKVVFPAKIHEVAADIRRQALQHPDRDPVVPGERRLRRKRKTARASSKRTGPARKTKTTSTKTKRARRK
jgi:hypothetical protein